MSDGLTYEKILAAKKILDAAPVLKQGRMVYFPSIEAVKRFCEESGFEFDPECIGGAQVVIVEGLPISDERT